jgi:HNH endonuclease
MIRLNWTEAEIQRLIDLFPNNYTQTVSKLLNRPYSSIVGKAYSLGLKKSEAFKKHYMTVCIENLKEVGKVYRFEKGSVPPNKGKKMPSVVYEKVQRTMFKKGNVPHNAKKEGTEVLRKQSNGGKYIMVKPPKNKRLCNKHVWLWEQTNGKVQKGFNVVFKDGNVLNCTIENLECISNAELMHRNSFKRFPLELRETIKLFYKLKKTIKKYAKKQN